MSEARWRATLAAALRVIDHHAAHLACRGTTVTDTPEAADPTEPPAGENQRQ